MKRKYQGKLGKPVDIELPKPPNQLLGSEAEEAYLREVRDIDALVDRERTERWRLLREFHGIAPQASWQEIATRLAEFHVPGLRFRKGVRVGAKQKWTAEELSRLKQRVDAARCQTGDLAEALKEVAAVLGWKGRLSTLRSRYYESRGSVKTVRK